MTAREVGVGCLLTATLLTVAMVVSFQPGRLAMQDAEERQSEGADAPHIRDAVRRRAMIVASPFRRLIFRPAHAAHERSPSGGA